MWADEAVENVKELFQAEFDSKGQPEEMALFVRHESDGRLHCQLMLYLPPNLKGLAGQIEAISCPVPLADDLSLLVGSESAWSIFFPSNFHAQ